MNSIYQMNGNQSLWRTIMHEGSWRSPLFTLLCNLGSTEECFNRRVGWVCSVKDGNVPLNYRPEFVERVMARIKTEIKDDVRCSAIQFRNEAEKNILAEIKSIRQEDIEQFVQRKHHFLLCGINSYRKLTSEFKMRRIGEETMGIFVCHVDSLYACMEPHLDKDRVIGLNIDHLAIRHIGNAVIVANGSTIESEFVCQHAGFFELTPSNIKEYFST